MGAVGQVNWKAFGLDGIPHGFEFSDQGVVRKSQFDIPSRAAGNAMEHIPVDVLQLTKQKSVRLYVWGWMTYNDVFRGTKKHLTRVLL